MTWGTKMETPNWHGHCNGWTAATIRHAEPQTSVKFNGVVFTPADIKGCWRRSTCTTTLTIWRESIRSRTGNLPRDHHRLAWPRGHPLGMEADPSEEKWNYPIYAFSSSSLKRSDRRVEVKLNLAYIKDSNGEYRESPRNRRIKPFHYDLYLNHQGEIIGGNSTPTAPSSTCCGCPPSQTRASEGQRIRQPVRGREQVLAIGARRLPRKNATSG